MAHSSRAESIYKRTIFSSICSTSWRTNMWKFYNNMFGSTHADGQHLGI